MLVSEVFVSIQGEGPSAGERAVFVRLAGCNLACQWCDTAYAWDWNRYSRVEETYLATVEQMAKEVCERADRDVKLLVLTGGEPMLQQRLVGELLAELRVRRPDLRCEVESNGTVGVTPEVADLVHRFVVSPKLEHAGGSSASRIHLEPLRTYAALPRTAFKLVVRGPGDLPAVAVLRAELQLGRDRVWLMPLADTEAQLLEQTPAVAELALQEGYNFTSRLQLLSWTNARGR